MVKEKLGKKHIISGFYPLTYLKSATKQQCIDKAKELIDILAPGGKYIFEFDKSPVSLNSVNVENYAAVLRYVAENAKYDNAGERSPAEEEASFSPKIDESERYIPEIRSKYFKTWEEYKREHPEIDPRLEAIIAEKLQSYEEMLFNMLFMLM